MVDNITTTIFAGLFLIKDDRILLLKRNDGSLSGWWGVPGGHVNVGETFSQATIREVFEETGVKINENNISKSIVVYSNKVTQFVGYYGFCDKRDGEPINNEPNKSIKLSWFKKDLLPKEITPFARAAFNGLLESKNYVEVI